MSDRIRSFEAMLARGQDNALLRFSLGSEYAAAGDWPRAVEHLRAAVSLDADYSAAWKLLGRALAESGDPAAALDAYDQGLDAAERRGDVQAAKEIRVFRRRLQKQTRP